MTAVDLGRWIDVIGCVREPRSISIPQVARDVFEDCMRCSLVEELQHHFEKQQKYKKKVPYYREIR